MSEDSIEKGKEIGIEGTFEEDLFPIRFSPEELPIGDFLSPVIEIGRIPKEGGEVGMITDLKDIEETNEKGKDEDDKKNRSLSGEK